MVATDRRFPHVRAGGGTALNVIGESITFKVTSAETGDTLSVAELVSQPGGGPPLHTHPAAEVFVILEGAFEFSGLDRGELYTIRATPGDTVFIPGGAPHTYKSVGATAGKALGIVTPGSEMERFFAAVGTPIDEQHPLTAPAGPPSADEIAHHMAIAARYHITFLPPQGVSVGR